MHRRVDVRAAVRAEGVDRQRQDIALSHLFQEFELHGRIARVHRSARGIECRGDIDPPLPAQLSRPLVRDTPHQETERQPRFQRLRDGHVAKLLEERGTSNIQETALDSVACGGLICRMRNRLLAALPTLALVLTPGAGAAQTALQLRWELSSDSNAVFTLTNRDTKPLPPSGWANYFSALHSA